ncbi:MAG: hypothetical protein GX323_03330 [Clostridiales bacterium]|nr:hypothetical protein [Clostridiales bacterium]
MSKINKQIYNNIRYGKDIDQSIPNYIETLRGLYANLSELNLGMNYFMFYENFIDSYHDMDSRDLSLLTRLNNIIKSSFASKENSNNDVSTSILSSNLIDDLDEIRNEIINRMKILTNYTDILVIYDYVLKRIEYRYSTDLEDIDDEQVSKQIYNYIFDSEDRVLINNKLSDVISQLPVRMSRYKYFDLLGESFSIFEEMTQASLESYLYMIRSSSMLYELAGMEDVFPELNLVKVELETSNYSDISQDEWSKLSSKLDETTETINYLADYYYGLQEMVNQLYIYLMNAKESNQESVGKELEGPMVSLISQINHNFTRGSLELTDELESLLSETEGVLEDLIGDISNMESVFSFIEDRYTNVLSSQGLDQLYDNLKKSQKFFTNSLFFELDKVEDDRVLTKEEIDKEKVNLLKDMETLFRKNSRYVNRAVMANTLNKIPGFLTNQDEVYEYIVSSLSQCRDSSEKKASINIIQSFWE